MRLLALLTLLALAACSKPQPPYTQESYVFGTRVQIAIWGEPEAKAKQAAAAVLGDLDRLHGKLHAWKPGQLTTLNQGFAQGNAPQPIDAELQQLLTQAQGYARQSGQLFNPAIGKLVAAWGFHADQFAPQQPAAATLAALLATQPTLDDLSFGPGSVSSRNRALQIDLGGLAKGWALDREIDYLRQHGINNALLNIGGNVRAIGSKAGSPWTIGLQHPRKPEAMAALELRDGEAIGTSGDYQRYFELNGKRYSHLIDPRSGQPARGMQAATVVVANRPDAGALSDAATKPLFIGGIASSMQYARKFDLNWILLIDDRGKIYLTRAAQQRLHWLNETPAMQLLD